MKARHSIATTALLLLLAGFSQVSIAENFADFEEGNKGLNSFNDYQQPLGITHATIINDNRINDNSINDNSTVDNSVNLANNVIGGNVEIGNNSHNNTTINNISVKQSAKPGKL